MGLACWLLLLLLQRLFPWLLLLLVALLLL
jgi:hypothetical protein